MNPNKPRPFYLPQLDGLRFFAFLFVFLHHLSNFKIFAPHGESLRQDNVVLSFFGMYGWSGVDLFFVLSAFLITELLIREKNLWNRISLKDFWIRRALRIWPLYFLVLFILFVFFRFIPFFAPDPLSSAQYSLEASNFLAAYVFFVGNFAIVAKGWPLTTTLALIWSICVEEQFYLFWPLVLKYLKPKKIGITIGLLFFISILYRFYLGKTHASQSTVYPNTLARLDPLLLGALVSFLWKKPILLKWNPILVPASITLSALCIYVSFFAGPHFFLCTPHITWQYFLMDLGYALLLYFVLNNGFSFLRIDILRNLGRISYGLYVFHIFGMKLASRLSGLLFSGQTNLGIDCLWALSSLLVTIGLASLSFRYIEKPFLKLKTKFTKIDSGQRI